MNPQPGSGHCLCKAVRIHVQHAQTSVGACHCNMCRNWAGGPFLAIDCGSAVTFEGEENISVFASSDWAERGFCRRCGSHLFYRLKENQQYIMSVGLFQQLHELVFDHQVFIEEKPEYYQFANHTKNLTGAELFAMFTGGKSV